MAGSKTVVCRGLDLTSIGLEFHYIHRSTFDMIALHRLQARTPTQFMSEASTIFSNWDRLKIFCQDPVWFVSHWWGTPWRDSRHLGLCTLHCVIYSVYHLYPIVSILKIVCPVAASIPASAIQWLSSSAKCRLEYR